MIFSVLFLSKTGIAQNYSQKKVALLPPVIDSVSVDPISGLAVIGWTQNPSNEVDSFYFYEFLPNNSPQWSKFHQINGDKTKTAFFSIIPFKDPSVASLTFNIAAIKNGDAPAWSLKAHRTIFLSTKYSNCNLQTNLVWNKYINWNNGVKEYKVLASIDGGPFQVIGTTAPADTFFVHSGLKPQSKYDYIVRAFETGSSKTSSSNKRMVKADFPLQPKFNYLSYVTVKSQTEIELLCLIDTIAEIEKYLIERKVNKGSYEVVKTILASSLKNLTTIKYIDKDLDTKNKTYSYTVKAIDFCGKTAYISEINNSILLKGENMPEAMSNKIKWNEYINWQGGTIHYNIYRSIDGKFNPSPIMVLPPGSTEYSEQLDDYYYTSGEFCYYIEAMEGPNNYVSQKSTSNKICLVQQPIIYIPSAFKLNGINNVFKPVISFVDPINYNFSVYDRWGNRVFESPEILNGWDGKINEAEAEEGIYIYHLNYSTALGTVQGKSGNVLLLK